MLEKIRSLGYDGMKDVFARKGYAFFDKGAFNINIFGVRRNESVSDTFNDALCYAYKDNDGTKRLVVCEGTTDPGLSVRKAPSNPNGAAILVPGQYRGVWEIGTHGAGRAIEHTALCQRKGTVRVYRDNNRDGVLDKDASKIDTGWFGINIHRASRYYDLESVGNYSAGCQVFRKVSDFNRFMSVVRASEKIYGNRFSYTLLEETDL